jgi:hypothetical protein
MESSIEVELNAESLEEEYDFWSSSKNNSRAEEPPSEFVQVPSSITSLSGNSSQICDFPLEDNSVTRPFREEVNANNVSMDEEEIEVGYDGQRRRSTIFQDGTIVVREEEPESEPRDMSFTEEDYQAHLFGNDLTPPRRSARSFKKQLGNLRPHHGGGPTLIRRLGSRLARRAGNDEETMVSTEDDTTLSPVHYVRGGETTFQDEGCSVHLIKMRRVPEV